MPDARTHAAATLLLAGATVPLVASEPKTALVTAGILAGLLFHPDLDSSRHPYWKLYAKLHKHRGLSHQPVIGTLGRVAWILGPVIIALLLVGAGLLWELAALWKLVALWILGLGLADLLHAALDWGEKRWKSFCR